MDKNKAISGYEKIFDDGYRAGSESVVLPHPCDGELYKHWTAADYFAKIAEEHLEVIDAYKMIEKSGKCPTEEEKEHFLKECTDLIIATTTLMNYFGYDEEARQKKMKEVNDDNSKRDGGKRFAKTEWKALERAYKLFGKSPYFEIGEIIEVDGPMRKEIGIILDENRNQDGYIVSIDGEPVDVPAKWVKKVKK